MESTSQERRIYGWKNTEESNKTNSRTERSNIWRTIKGMWTDNTRNAKIKGGSNISV